MNGWELFLGLGLGNLLTLWAVGERCKELQRDFDEAVILCDRSNALNQQLLECLVSRNRRVCQPKEN